MSHKQLVEEIAEDIKTMPLTEVKEMVGLLTNFHETYLENKAIQDRDTERNATFKMSSAKQAEQHLLQGIRIEEL